MNHLKTITVVVLMCLTLSSLSGTIIFVQACEPASKLVFSAGASQVLQAGTISNQTTVQLRDASNNPVNANSNITVNLATNASSSGHFYSDQNGKNQISWITIMEGQNSAKFYYQDTIAGNLTVTASSQNLNSATTQFTIKPASLDHFSFQPISSPQFTGLPFKIAITAQDNYGNTITNYTGLNTLNDSTLTITPKSTTAFQLGVWSGIVTLTIPGPAITISTSGSNHTGISYQFTVSQYTIIPSVLGGHGTISPNTVQAANYGGTPSFTITSDIGYHIFDVQVDSVSVLNNTVSGIYTFPAICNNHQISAIFAINQYNITASYDNNGQINPSGVSVIKHGENQTFTLTPNKGYQIANVMVDGVSQGTITSYAFTNVIANHTINAVFTAGITQTPIPTPSPTSAPAPTTSPSPTQDPTTTQTPSPTTTLTPNPTNPTPTSSQTSTTSLAFTSISVTQSIFKITVISAHGSPTASGNVKAGASFTASVTNPDGNETDRWISIGYTIDNAAPASGTSYIFTNVQASHTITFNWQEQYYLNVTSDYGFTAGSGWYNSGSKAKFTVIQYATDNVGNPLEFVAWKGNGTGAYTGTGTLHSVTMSNPITEMATWTIPSTSLYTVGESAFILFALLLLISLLLAVRRRRKTKQTQNSAQNQNQ